MKAFNHYDVLSAFWRIERHVRRTPLVRSSSFDGWLKLETLQLTGAFKVRGAMNALMKQVKSGDLRPIVTASAGNHAAGVAWAARALGLAAITVVPSKAPQNKIARTEKLGAQVIRHGDDFEEAYKEAINLANTHEWHFLHPFDDPDVIAGQGTIGAELLAFNPEVVVVPIGGGGLASGVGTLLNAYGISVVGVQVKGVNAMARMLARDESAFNPTGTVADGVKVRCVTQRTAAICSRVLDDIVMVTEDEVRTAMAQLAADDHVMAEGAGAMAAAALAKLPGHRKVAIVSGGNVDPAVLARVMRDVESRPEATKREESSNIWHIPLRN